MTAALLVVLLVQDSPDDLIRQLTVEDAEVRDKAAGKLIRIGEPARAGLEKAQRTEDEGLKKRIAQILGALDARREVGSFYGPPVRVTLVGETTLKEAASILEKASGHVVTAEEWPADRFRVELRDRPYWAAVEEICAASGKRTPRLTEKGLKLEGTRYLRKPHIELGGMTLRLDEVERGRSFEMDDRAESHLLAFTMVLGWERSCAPAWAYWDVHSALDDQGVDHKKAIDTFAKTGSDGMRTSAEEPPPRFCDTYYLVTESPPGPKSRVMSELKGRMLVWLKASEQDLTFEVSEEESPDVTEKIQIFDTDHMAVGEVRIIQSEGMYFRFEGVDIRMVERYSRLAIGIDSQGKRYPGSGHIDRDAPQVVSMGFSGIPDDSRIERIRLRIPRRVIQVEILFAFKDIPVN